MGETGCPLRATAQSLRADDGVRLAHVRAVVADVVAAAESPGASDSGMKGSPG